MKKFASLGIVSALLVSSALLFAAPAMASGITVDVHTHADNIGQLGLAGADASNSAIASVDNIASLGSLDGWGTGNVNMSATVNNVIQLGASVAVSEFGGTGGTADATVANIAGLITGTVQNVDNNAWINTSASASQVAQAGLSLALAGVNATADVTNFAGGDIVKVNVGN